MWSLLETARRVAPGPKQPHIVYVLQIGPAPDEGTDGGQPVEMLICLVRLPL